MAARTPIVNISGDHEETLLQLARHLGTDKMRRKVFNTIYGYGTRPRSKKQIMEAARIADRHSQQAQNALDHLAKHHLIVKEDNDGSVRDGSRYLYRKDESVRANRVRIITYADNRRAAEKIATKRRPFIRGISSIRTIKRQALRRRARLNVLYLTADPDKHNPLRVDAEIALVQDAIRGSAFRDNINVEYRPAANLKTLLNGLNDHRPQIVHFSGHGDATEITTDNLRVAKRADEAVSFELLARAVSATDDPPQVIVLNSCSSSGARKVLLPLGLMIISMRTPVSDIAATAFASLFYAAIAGGQSVKSAFEQGKVAVEAVSISEAGTPELFHPAGTDPGKVILT
jgi:hypothetical protein